MIENYLGEETFRQGVHNYLFAHEYANATGKIFGARRPPPATAGGKIMESLVAQPASRC